MGMPAYGLLGAPRSRAACCNCFECAGDTDANRHTRFDAVQPGGHADWAADSKGRFASRDADADTVADRLCYLFSDCLFRNDSSYCPDSCDDADAAAAGHTPAGGADVYCAARAADCDAGAHLDAAADCAAHPGDGVGEQSRPGAG